MNEVKVFERPKYLTDNPSKLDHTIIITPMDDVENNFIVPLSLSGVTSYFPTRKPTTKDYELAEREGRSYNLNYDSPEWDPHEDTFCNQEIVAEEKLEMEVRRLSFCAPTKILEEITLRGHSSHCTPNYSLHDAAHSVYERSSQCASVLS